MFKKLFRKRPRSNTRIFAFHDGEKWRSIDPIEVLCKLDEHEKFTPDLRKQVASGDLEATQIVAEAVCDVFGVVPYLDGKGLTTGERIALLQAFDAYCLWVKKNTGSSVISPRSTAAT